MEMDKKDCPQYVTTSFVASYCGVSGVTVLRWIEKGLLPAFRLPQGHYRIRLEDVSRFLERCNVKSHLLEDKADSSGNHKRSVMG